MGSLPAAMVELESDYATSLIACFDPRQSRQLGWLIQVEVCCVDEAAAP